jgi:hypothetical protein
MGQGKNQFYFIGVDLGQSMDSTAIAIVERREEAGEFDYVKRAHRKVVTRWLRYLERVPLGTPYTKVVDRIVELTTSAEMMERCCLTVDATGVGRPVLDMLRRARPMCTVVPVLFTAGDQETVVNGMYRVPKRDLVSELVVMLQADELSICEGLKDVEQLVREMMDMRVRMRRTGYEEYRAFGADSHDDKVMATALSCWALRRSGAGELDGDNAYVIDCAWEEKVRRFRRHVEWCFRG